MGKKQKKRRGALSRQERLKRLDRFLLRIGVAFFIIAGVIELLSPAGFSILRFAILYGISIMGLLIGRTIGKWMFINRQL